jgi:hypothetical protein
MMTFQIALQLLLLLLLGLLSAVCCLSVSHSLLWVKIEIRSEMQKSRKFAFFFFFFFFFSSFVDEKK